MPAWFIENGAAPTAILKDFTVHSHRNRRPAKESPVTYLGHDANHYP